MTDDELDRATYEALAHHLIHSERHYDGHPFWPLSGELKERTGEDPIDTWTTVAVWPGFRASEHADAVIERLHSVLLKFKEDGWGEGYGRARIGDQALFYYWFEEGLFAVQPQNRAGERSPFFPEADQEGPAMS